MVNLNQLTTTVMKVLIMTSFFIALSESFQSSASIRQDIVLYSNIEASSECPSSVCNHTCIYRSRFPAYEDGLIEMGDNCMAVEDGTDLPKAANKSALNVLFTDNSNCSHVEMSVNASTEGLFSLSFWVKANFVTNRTFVLIRGGNMALFILEKRLDVHVSTSVFAVSDFKSANWNHLVLRFTDTVQVFVNGDLEVASLQDKIQSETLEIGPQTGNMGDQDFLAIADVRLYPEVLTDREIKALYDGSAVLETLRSETECRCPNNAPSLVDISEIWCTNSVGGVAVRRVNPDGGYADFLNDNDTSTTWRSGANVRTANVSVQLKNVFQMDNLAVFGLEPDNIDLKVQFHYQGQITQEMTFTDSDCGSTANCHDLTDINGTPFKLDDSSISNMEELSKLLADTVVITMTSSVSTQFAISELQFHVRCHCSGNDPSCSVNATGYTCICASNTRGTHCENCREEFYKETQELACFHPCNCNVSGSVNNVCNQVGGQCTCKSNVNESASRKCDVCNFNSVNLGSDDSEGCTGCQCNPYGIQSCETDQTCVCKDNFETSTGRCEKCLPGFYSIHLREGCIPCECDTKGTKDEMIGQCDDLTGQCDCKTNVQGRRCSECKDGLYNLRSDSVTGCEDLCSCNFVGSVNTITCEMESGNCSCIDGIQPNRQCLPEIVSVGPLYGPVAGGTVISIHGVLFGTHDTSNLTFFIDSEIQNITFRNSSLITIESNPNNGVEHASISLVWNKNSLSHRPDHFDTRTFEYKPNPSLLTSQKFYTYASGGCSLRVAGSNMNSTYLPRIVIHISIDDKFNDCEPISDTEMICWTPNVLKYNLTGKASFGFIFDGFRNYETMTDDAGEVTVLQDPIITGYTDTFGNTFDKEIEIKGERLNLACGDDLKVLIGEKQCDIRTVSDTSIICEPDESFPGDNREESLVVVFGYLKLEPGKITFKDFWSTKEFLYIAIGVGCLLLICIVILILFCVFRHRKKIMGQRNSLMMDLVEKPPENTAQPNVYLGGVNPAMVSITTNLKDSNAENIVKDFMHRVRSDIRKILKSSVIDRGNIKPGKICTKKGTKMRIINGTFTDKSGIAGDRITIKTLISPYSESGDIPDWLQKGLLESTKFRDFIHDHVLQCRGLSVDEKQVYVLYPEMSKRTLKEYLTDASESFTEEKRLDICVQVAEGMNYLDSHNIVHKDLAARNCWVNSEDIVKISDGSFSPDLYPDEYLYKTGFYLPVRWMAPESLKQLGFYHAKSDVWSFGVLMWEVFTNGYLPYYDIADNEQIVEFVCNKGYGLGKPYDCSDKIFHVIELCHTDESEERLNFFLVTNHLTEIISPTQPASYVNQDSLQDEIYQNTLRLNRR